MSIKNLICEANDIRQQRQHLQAQDKHLKERLESIDAEIRSFVSGTGENYEDLSEDEFQALLSKMGDTAQITVEVVYASGNEQHINEIQVPAGACVEDAIVLSGILETCPVIDLSLNKVGIFGTIKPLSEALHDGDRIEIYRAVTTG